MNKQLQEKIKLSEELVDKYLNEISPYAINTAMNMYHTAKGVLKDTQDVKKYITKKIDDKKRAMIQKKNEKKKEAEARRRKSGGKGMFGGRLKW